MTFGTTLVLSVASLVVPYNCTLSHKQHDLKKKKVLNVKRVF